MTTDTPTKTATNSLKYRKTIHPNSLANLELGKFQKGNNGNHNTEGYSLTSLLKDALIFPLKEPRPDATVRELLVYSTITGALAREPGPFAQVWDRIDGKVIERRMSINVTTTPELLAEAQAILIGDRQAETLLLSEVDD